MKTISNFKSAHYSEAMRESEQFLVGDSACHSVEFVVAAQAASRTERDGAGAPTTNIVVLDPRALTGTNADLS